MVLIFSDSIKKSFGLHTLFVLKKFWIQVSLLSLLLTKEASGVSSDLSHLLTKQASGVSSYLGLLITKRATDV